MALVASSAEDTVSLDTLFLVVPKAHAEWLAAEASHGQGSGDIEGVLNAGVVAGHLVCSCSPRDERIHARAIDDSSQGIDIQVADQCSGQLQHANCIFDGEARFALGNWGSSLV